jgi:hypothetical protein
MGVGSTHTLEAVLPLIGSLTPPFFHGGYRKVEHAAMAMCPPDRRRRYDRTWIPTEGFSPGVRTGERVWGGEAILKWQKQ